MPAKCVVALFQIQKSLYLSILSDAKTIGIFLPFGFGPAELTWVTAAAAGDAVTLELAEAPTEAFFGGNGRCGLALTERLSEEVLLPEASSNTEGKLVMEPASPP